MKVSERERTLMIVVGAVVFLLLNLVLIRAFSQRNATLRAELSQQKLAWSGMQLLLADKPMWAARDAALTEKQPHLTNENAAGVELYDMLKEMAQRHSIAISNPVLNGEVEKMANYQSVPVSFDTSSTWPELIAFLYTVQRPDQFLVCELANIQVDPADPTKMVGHFKIARWYAP